MNQQLIKAATGSADEAVFLGLDSHLLFCLGRLSFPAVGLCADDYLSQGWWREGRTALCLVTDNPTSVEFPVSFTLGVVRLSKCKLGPRFHLRFSCTSFKTECFLEIQM